MTQKLLLQIKFSEKLVIKKFSICVELSAVLSHYRNQTKNSLISIVYHQADFYGNSKIKKKYETLENERVPSTY